jgi:hypothetical protein
VNFFVSKCLTKEKIFFWNFFFCIIHVRKEILKVWNTFNFKTKQILKDCVTHRKKCFHRKMFFWCYVKCLVLKTKTLKVLQIFTTHSCDTTQFSRCLAVVTQFPVISRFFPVQNIEKFGVFQFQSQANVEGFYNTPKFFLCIFTSCGKFPRVFSLLVVAKHMTKFSRVFSPIVVNSLVYFHISW